MRIITDREDGKIFPRLIKVARKGIFKGTNQNEPYFLMCKWYIQKYDASIIFTRDEGYHSSGWWKNPDFERCWHLSIYFPEGTNKNNLMKILKGLFGHNIKNLWSEAPYSPEAVKSDIWHYRLFCDENWLAIKPKGEVYSSENTGLTWKSFSEKNRF